MTTPTKQTVYLPKSTFPLSMKGKVDDLFCLQQGYFFTPEQLNEYTQGVIKQALETAAEKAKVVKDLGEDLNGIPAYEVTEYYYDENDYPIYTEKESITNTFEETFKQFEV
jgi:hypothetical protein